MTKLLSTFGDELAKKVSAVTGRLHSGFKVASTKAGRFSCSDPNIQQIPKHKAGGFRGCFVAPPGRVLVIADYNAMELRAAAEVYNDAAMRADFANGVDLHRRQAAEMLGIPQEAVTKDQRDAAKPICFGTIYGAGRHGLRASAWNSYGILLTEGEAETARQAFLRRYPDLAAGMDRSYTQSNEQSFITIGKLGRVIEAAWESPELPNKSYTYHRGDDSDALFDTTDDDEEWLARQVSRRAELKRTLCCNAPIQGACADAAMRALILVDTAMIDAGIDGGPVLFVHDEIVVEVPETDAEHARTIVVEAMTRAFAETFPDAPLNGLVETTVSTSWGPREEHDATTEPVDADAGGPDLPPRGVPCPADGGDTAPSADQGGRAAGGGLSPHERVDVPAADTSLSDQGGDEEVHRTPEPSAAFLLRRCDRCGASPCTVFGQTTTFCTLECWQAIYSAS
jgi:DNA polymerase I-like protein with 3'-5' exonuclease and polymerase domains